MRKYIFTESQIKNVINNVIKEQFGGTDSPEDMQHIQKALNKYFKSKNIKAIWDNKNSFNLDPKGQVITLKEDGIWGDKSKSALEIFQNKVGLTPDGIIGCHSIKALIQTGFLQKDIFGRLMDFFGWGSNCS
jgi:peptidoglycan hydrolase-like protein with peptidoglycan-binding domain